MGGRPPEAAIPGLAANLHWLRDNIPNSLGERRTWANIADEMTALGYPISFAAITKIASGQVQSPAARTLYYICQVFEVPLDFFFNERTNRDYKAQILNL